MKSVVVLVLCMLFSIASLAKIKIGRMALVMCHSPALLLESELKEVGVEDYETRFFTKGSMSALALGARETDVAFFGAIIPAIANGLKAKIIAVNSMGGTQLVCRKDSNVKSLKDLAGKSIGSIGPTSAPTSILKLALSDAGVLDKVKLKHINRQVIVSAMVDQKVVECASILEPLTAEAVKSGAKVVLDHKSLYNKGNYPFTFVVAHQDAIREKRKDVEKVLSAHLNAQKRLGNKDAKAYSKVRSYFSENGIEISEDKFEGAMNTNIFKPQISKRVINKLLKMMAASKIISSDIKFDDVVDCSFGQCVD